MLLLSAPEDSPSIAYRRMEIDAPGKLLAPRPAPHPAGPAVPFARWPPNRMFTRQLSLPGAPVQAAPAPEPTVKVTVSSDWLSEFVLGSPTFVIALIAVRVPPKSTICFSAGLAPWRAETA